MGGGKTVPQAPEPPEADPMPTTEQSSEPVSQAVRNNEQRELRQRRGASGTILTSPLGVAGQDDETLIG